MTKDFEIKLPKLGESIVSATIVKIYKKEGEKILKDESLMEVATDKVNSEIPSPIQGIIKKILVKENQSVQVGDVIVIVCIESENADTKSNIKEEKKITSFEKEKEDNLDKKSFFSPAVMRFAKENNLTLDDLEKIQGTGEQKRVTKKDVQDFLQTQAVANKIDEDINILEMTPIRKTIATNMTKSLSVPHAYLVDDIDVSDLVEFIFSKKQLFLEIHQAKLTISAYLVKAITLAAIKYPLANSSYKDDKILLKKIINLGLAVNVKDDVLVPVIQNIKNLEFVEIVNQVNNLVKKARKNELTKDDVSNGTITLTNFGMMNITTGLAIIKYPEAVIIGAGAIKKKVCPIDHQVKIRSILTLSMSFDHRIFDGIYACNFLNEIKKYLEHDFDRSF